MEITQDYYRKCSICKKVSDKVVVLPGFYKLCTKCVDKVIEVRDQPEVSRDEVLLGLIKRICK